MSAEQNIETARQMYQAFGRVDVPVILDRVTGDVDWSTDAAIGIARYAQDHLRADGTVLLIEPSALDGKAANLTANPMAALSRPAPAHAARQSRS